MGFQSTVNLNMSFGLPGEIQYDGPQRVVVATLKSTTPANNVIGSAAAFYTADGKGVAVDSTAGTGAFAGVLSSPKEFASYGTTAGGTLANTLVLPNNIDAQLLAEGEILVMLPAAANIGDVVYAKNADGTFITTAPGAAVPATSRLVGDKGATVSRFPVTAAGPAIIHVI